MRDMRRNVLHRLITALMTTLLMVFMVLTGCERKPLYLSVGDNVNIEVAVYDIRLELLWGINWEANWHYDWNAHLYGDMGYTAPEWVRATIYTSDSVGSFRKDPQVRNFDAKGGRVTLKPGGWYDMLFYSAGTEYVLYSYDEDNSYYNATTRTSSGVGNYTRNEVDENGDTIGTYVQMNQPDELFGTFLDELRVSEDPDDYEKTIDEEDNIVYLYKIDATMNPYSFIYLYQLLILNNEDSIGNKIVGGRGLTVTGLSRGTNLFSRMTFDNVISLSSEDIKPMINDVNLKLEDGTETHADVMACRMLTWGLPGINPLEEVSYYSHTRVDANGEFERRQYVSPLDSNYVGVALTLRNGNTLNIARNITTEMNNHPAGGIITIIVDASTIPEKALDPNYGGGGSTSGGGFNAKVEDWANTEEAEITI